MNEAKKLIETPTSKKAKKSKKMETKALHYWDSVQKKSVNKTIQERKFRAELVQLRKEFGLNVVSDYIFGIPNEFTDDFVQQKEEIEAEYAGKRMDTSVNDRGEYVYSDEEIKEIEFMKLNSL